MNGKLSFRKKKKNRRDFKHMQRVCKEASETIIRSSKGKTRKKRKIFSKKIVSLVGFGF